MGEGDEAGFDCDFFEASEHESSESLVLFYVSEYRFDFVSLRSFFYSLLACQQLFYFLSMPDQVCVSLDGAVALGRMTRASHRASATVCRLVHSRLFLMAADARSLREADVRHRLADRARVCVILRIVIKIVRVKCVRLMLPVIQLFVE